jgi:hypothetical protein
MGFPATEFQSAWAVVVPVVVWVILLFLTGLAWCGVARLGRIAQSLQRIADATEKKEQG